MELRCLLLLFLDLRELSCLDAIEPSLALFEEARYGGGGRRFRWDATFLLTIGNFLLPVQLFCLQLRLEWEHVSEHLDGL